MSFHVGQKVVCVDDAPCFSIPMPFKRGDVLTVSGFTHTGCVSLVEHPKKPFTGYFRERFRPVIERKTDISAFNALLNPANHKYLERAE